MENKKSNNGITLVSLVVTIVVLLIISVSVTAGISSTFKLQDYYDTKEDILRLSESVNKYYLEHDGDISDIQGEQIEFNIGEKDLNPNDNEIYYLINRDELEVDTKKDNTYIFNEKTLTVYCKEGYRFKDDDEMHYTAVDDFEVNTFASDYYSKIDIPQISVVTLESNNKEDKYHAKPLDNITLKLLKTIGEFDDEFVSNLNASVTFKNGSLISNDCNVETKGRIMTITYKNISQSESDNDRLLNLNIEYNGEKIFEKPSFSNGILYSAEAYRYQQGNGLVSNGLVTMNIGDTIRGYTLDKTVRNSSYTSSLDKNGFVDQTFKLGNQDYEWKILGANEEGELLITTVEPVENLMLNGKNGYTNAQEELDNICEIFSHSEISTGSRSFNEDDVNNLTGYDPLNHNDEGVPCGNGEIWEYGNKLTYLWGEQESPYYIEEGSNQEENLEETHLGVFQWYDGDEWQTSIHPEEATNDNQVKITDMESDYYVYEKQDYSTINEKVEDLIYTKNPYWLASPYIGTGDQSVNFGIRGVTNNLVSGTSLVSSTGNTSAEIADYGIRPVVSIKASALIKKTSDGAWEIADSTNVKK